VPVDFDADTPYYQQIEDHARGAAGAEIATVDLALSWMKGFSLMLSAQPSCDSDQDDGLLLFEFYFHRRPITLSQLLPKGRHMGFQRTPWQRN
jgi:hypothetical protein